MNKNTLIFSLGSNDALAEKICRQLKTKLGKIIINNFSDGEQNIQFSENLRGKTVFLIQSTNQPDNNFIKLVLAADAAKRASAKAVIAVIPYFGYARQERKSAPRTPISAKVFSDILELVGINKILTMDLHTNAIEGFFHKTIVEHIYARPVFLNFLKEKFKKEIANYELLFVSPDAGAAGRTRAYSLRLFNNSYTPMISKGREKAGVVSHMELMGDVTGKNVIIVDDMADTCGTVVKAAELLKERGAKSVRAIITHGIFSKDALQKIELSCIQEFFVTDTIYKENTKSKKIVYVSVSKIFAEAIKCLLADKSISKLLN